MDYDYIKKLKFGYPFAKTIVERPKTFLFAFILLTAFLTAGFSKIKSRFSVRIWFDADHPNILKLDKFEKKFGSDEGIAIGIFHPKGMLEADNLKVVKELTDKLWKVDDIIRVESLTNKNDIITIGDDIEVAPFVDDDFDYSRARLNKLRKRILKDELIPDLYLSTDETFSMIHGYLKPFHEGTKTYQKVTSETKKLVEEYQGRTGLKFYIVGSVPSTDAFREISRKDNLKIIPVMIFFIVFFLFLIFRSIEFVIIPLLLAVTTIFSSMGLIGITGIYFNNLLSAIPGILLAICLADSLHILFTYRYFRSLKFPAKKAATYSLAKNFRATLLTSVSTGISFYSISFTDIAPIRDLGLIVTFGSFLAWLSSYIFIGPSLSLLSSRLDRRQTKDVQKGDRVDLTKIVSFIEKYRVLLVIGFISASGLSLAIALKNEVNSDPVKFFDKKLKFRQDYDFTLSKMDGLKGIELTVDSGKKEGIKDPIFLKKLDNFIKQVSEDPDIVKIRSFIDIVKDLNQSLNEGNSDFYKIPDTSNGVGEIILFYTMGLPQGMDLNNQISLDNRVIRLRVIWKLEMSKERELKANWLIEEGKKIGLKIDTGGSTPIYNSINSLVVVTFFSSMGMAIILVSLLLLIIFKDFSLSLFSLFPNIIPLIFGGCVMQLMGEYIDIGTSLVCAVCLGIAVDDTIHFVANYKTYRNLGCSTRDSIAQTFQITGKALIYTTFLLVVGFGSFIFSEFIPNKNFGILCSITLMMALLTDIIFLPALFFIVDKD